ncbi:MAG: hypothetical protein ACRD0K_28520 [Egibacteraceae bacterium]
MRAAHTSWAAHRSTTDRAVRERLRTVLEGGEEAFRRRIEKYGGI